MPGFEVFPDDRTIRLPAEISRDGSESHSQTEILARGLPDGLFEFAVGDLRALINSLKPEDVVRLQIPHDLRTADRTREDSLRFLDGAVVIEPSRREVIIEDEITPFSPKQFAVLHFLAFNAGRLVQRSTIYEAVWGDNLNRGRTLDVHVKRCREHLGDFSWLIQTSTAMCGFENGGYMFDDTRPQE